MIYVFSNKGDKLSKQCKAITKDGTQCEKKARLFGYCMMHFLHKEYKEDKKATKHRKELEAKEQELDLSK